MTCCDNDKTRRREISIETRFPPVCGGKAKEVQKGAWRMPWLSEATKDATSCEKPRSGASGH